jgi:oxygen-independent coproporphyrinogen-3 oxidase
MQEACQARLAQAGLAQYEVSAYARAGGECAHNLNYWNFGDYLGIGAGAHAKLTGAGDSVRRRWKLRAPRGYLEHAGSPRGIGGDNVIATQQLPFEFMLNALRLNAGFALDDFAARTGLPTQAIAPMLADARNRGWLECEDRHVRATELGRRFLNDVIASFLPAKPTKPHAHGGPPHA